MNELAYAVIGTAELEAWSKFAATVLGIEATRCDTGVQLKLDVRAFRYLFLANKSERLPTVGWAVADARALDRVAQRVSGLGLEVLEMDESFRRHRGLHAAIHFQCHNGIQHEIAYGFGPEKPVALSEAVSGFVTLDGGLGHVVWTVPDLAAMDELMLGAIGMSLRENIPTPLGAGHFYGCNPRHHSLAVFAGKDLRLEHFLVEMLELDDVGLALDRAIEGGYEVTQPLGRHRTDHMVSFYVQTPSGFGMEIGCGGVLCGDDWEFVREMSRRRPWGHGSAMRNHQRALADAATTKTTGE